MAAIMLRSRSRLIAVATSRPERKICARGFLQTQFALQVAQPDSSPAMPQSLGEQLMILGNRHALEDVILGMIQRRRARIHSRM